MRRSKELIVLVVLLLGTVAFILWYVVDRRAKNRETGTPDNRLVGPLSAPAIGDGPNGAATETPKPLSFEQVDGKTLDLSRGKPVLKDTPEDRAAMEAALKEMEEATKDVTFDAPKPGDPGKK